MSEATKLGRVQSGTELPTGSNFGEHVLKQTAVIDFDADLVQSHEFKIPAGSQIVDLFFDTLVVYNSATSATVAFGDALSGTEYGGSMNAKVAGRLRPTYTAAILAAMDDVGAETSVFVTVTSVGQPSAGSGRATILYTMP